MSFVSQPGYRPEFEPPWAMRSHMTSIQLNHLERPQIEALTQHLAGGKALPGEVVEHIVSKTDGVPLFVEEMTKMLIESDLLREEPEQYVLAGPLRSVAIPDTLQDSLMARLDQLDSAKEVAQLGAVLGREFPYELIQAIWSQHEETLLAGLAQLVETELLYQRGRPPVSKYIFKHALIQDTAYASLLRSTRQRVHQQIADLLEAQFPDIADLQPEIVAHHYSAAGCHQQAVDYWQRAGLRANEGSAYREMVVCFEQALGALGHLPESRAKMERDLDLRLHLRNALLPLAEHKQIYETLCEAERLCESLGDQPQLGRVLSFMARYFIAIGDHDRAVDFAQRALSIAADLEDFSLQVVANLYLGAANHHMGNYRMAWGVLEQIILAPEDERSRECFGLPYLPSVFARNFLVRSLAELGEFSIGYSRAEEGVRIAEVIDQPWDRAAAYFGVGVLFLRQGNQQEAISFFERALCLLQSTNSSEWLGITAAKLISASALSGCVTESLSVLEPEVKGRAQRGQIGRLSPAICVLGEAYLLDGRVQDALDQAEYSLALARTCKERGYEAWSLQLLGDIAMHHNPPNIDQTQTYYQQALALANELGMRPLQAHCHRGLGKFYSQTGRAEQARAELSMAIDMYRDMEMTFWLPETEAALRQVASKG